MSRKKEISVRILTARDAKEANKRIRRILRFTDADFVAMRRPYDDRRRTASKRALLRRVKHERQKSGQGLYG
jgi:hypothetical protein